MAITPTRNRRSEVESWWPLVRDIISFFLGVMGFLWQMVVETTPDPTLLAASIALVGLPAAARVQRRARQQASEEDG